MAGSGPAGEVTMDDVRRRLRSVTDRLTEAMSHQQETALRLVADREPVIPPGTPTGPTDHQEDGDTG